MTIALLYLHEIIVQFLSAVLYMYMYFKSFHKESYLACMYFLVIVVITLKNSTLYTYNIQKYIHTKTNISKFQFDLEHTDTFERVSRALWCFMGK